MTAAEDKCVFDPVSTRAGLIASAVVKQKKEKAMDMSRKRFYST